MTQLAPRASATPAAIWTALVLVYVVWGSTYLAIRVVVESAPPLLAMGVRFLCAAALLAVFLAWRRGWRSLRVTPRQLGAAAVVGFLLLLTGNGFVAIAEQTVPSGLTALLVAATPLWLVLMRASTGDRARLVSLLGTLVGFGGIALLALPGSRDGEVETWGVVLVAVASLCWALGSFLSSRLPMPDDPFVATTWEMLAGGALLLVAGGLRGESVDLGAVEPEGWWALVYLITVGSLVGYSAYVWLLANAPISLTATYAYVNPVVAVFLGALILDEAITAAILVGGAIVVVGVGLVVSSERPRRSAAARRDPALEGDAADETDETDRTGTAEVTAPR